jgi:metal-responsive CopG/Arc/MetJ family transcriptional regulator
MNRRANKGSSKRRRQSARVALTVRLPEDVVERIDQQLDDRDVPLSRNNWFIEAAIEKLRRSDAEESHGQK